jgi:hypothetical protein
MTPIEIILILIGAGIIIFSGFLVEKSDGKNNLLPNDKNQNPAELTTDNIKEIKNKIDTIITQATDDTIINTEDQLNKITNEKIIAVNDYSKIVLDKVSQNHEEVVFLYNMLNEKESEIKELLNQMESSKTTIYENKVEALPKVNLTSNETEEVMNRNKDLEVNTGDTVENSNHEILELYKNGKSILEISKLLEIGQGEVKLVIDLFN